LEKEIKRNTCQNQPRQKASTHFNKQAVIQASRRPWREDHGLRLASEKSERPYLKMTKAKIVGGVAQVVDEHSPNMRKALSSNPST
jgi:hypothetical protein